MTLWRLAYLCMEFVYSSPLLPLDKAPGELLSTCLSFLASLSSEHLLALFRQGYRRMSRYSIPSTASHRYFALRMTCLVLIKYLNADNHGYCNLSLVWDLYQLAGFWPTGKLWPTDSTWLHWALNSDMTLSH